MPRHRQPPTPMPRHRQSYWDPAKTWTIDAFMVDSYQPQECKDTTLLLQTRWARCGGWAFFLADAFALQGIAAIQEQVSAEPEWKDIAPVDAQYMLVKLWTFDGSNGPPAFRHIYQVQMPPPDGPAASDVPPPPPPPPPQGIGYRVLKADISYLPGPPYSGQGMPASPQGLFQKGDHDIVRFGGTLYDPSYGGRYGSLRKWADASLDGWAILDDSTDGGAPSGVCTRGTMCTLSVRAMDER